MKRILVSIFCIASLLTISACNSNVVVKTDIGNITKDEFYEEMKNNVGESVLQNMIILKVLEEEYGVTKEEEEEMMEELLSNPDFQMMLWQSGIAFDDEDRIRSIARNLILEDKLQFEGLEATDEELEEKYNEMLEEHELEIRASHILAKVEDKEDDDEVEEAKKKIEEVKAKLNAGEDFGELAKEYSDDSSAEEEGDIGYFKSGMMVSEFEEAAFNLSEGEISDIVESDFGFHIIKVTHIPTLEESKDIVERQIFEEKVDHEEVMQKLQRLISDANIDIKIKGFEQLQDSLSYEEPIIEGPDNDLLEDESENEENNVEENNDANQDNEDNEEENEKNNENE